MTACRFAGALLALLALAVPAAGLTIGDPVPALTFTDIDGVAGSNAAYRGWVQVLTVADRESSEKMSEWMNATGVEVARKYPHLRVAYIGFADLQVVPGFMRSVAEPILRRFNRRSLAQQDELYAKAGVKIDRSKGAFHLVPDWDGAFMKQLGVADATVWRCWIALDGKIVEVIDGTTTDGAARYVAAFGRAAAATRGAAADPGATAGGAPPAP